MAFLKKYLDIFLKNSILTFLIVNKKFVEIRLKFEIHILLPEKSSFKRTMSSATPKSEAKEEKVKKVSDKDLDLSNANRGVWLVKVPKYIAERWESGNTGKDVGKLKITRVQGQKPKVSFSLEDSLTKAMPENKEIEQKTSIPKDHTFMISANANQTLAVFSCTTGEPTDDAPG